MATDSFWHLQAALHAHLAQNAGLTALLAAGAAGIHDHVPRTAAFPYIVIGDMTARPEDTQQGGAYDVTLTFHAYSRGAGQQEVKRLLAALSDALQNGAINVAGHELVLCREVGASVQLEADGETRHGRLACRLIVEPIA